MTDDEIKAKCEMLFQNGYSRAIIVSDNGDTYRNSISLAYAQRVRYGDERVFARRKQKSGRYEWKEFK